MERNRVCIFIEEELLLLRFILSFIVFHLLVILNMKKTIARQAILFTLLFITICCCGQSNYFSSQEVTVPVKGGSLYGTLYLPVGVKKPPIVLIIAGSGPTDRDGNSILLPGKNNSLLQLADSLAKNKIASLRFDKRGVGKSKIENMVEDSMLFSDGINDVLVWCNYLQNKKYKKIYIAGHSEGSLIGMSAAAQCNASGFISIAGAGRKIDVVLKEQLATLPEGLREESYRNLDSLAMGKRIDKPNKMLYSIFRPSVQLYMISWMQYDPQKIIRSLKCPVLIIQGTNDIQVQKTDAENLYAAKPSSTLLIIKNMNHVFKEVWSEKKEDNQKAYSNPSLPVMREMVSGIVTFITTKTK
jgi:uncharacterized protein